MEPREFLDILRRRKWMILFFVLLIHFGAVVYCVLTPVQYKSTMNLLLIPPTVSEEAASAGGMKKGPQHVATRERLNILQQEILSRVRILGVINELGLFKESGNNAEALVSQVRKRLKTDLDRNNRFTLSFEHEDPKVAMMVTSRLGAFFIEENIKSREETGEQTSKFLEDQVEETRKSLEAQEEKIKQYKIRFGGELPQQEQANLNRLQRLQDQIKNNSDSMARLADRKVFMEAQISNIERNAQGPDDQDPWEIVTTGDQPSPRSLHSELAMRKKKLEELSQKYTPLYPAVVQARWEVEQLEAKIAARRQAARKAKEESTRGGAKPSTSKSTPELEPEDVDVGERGRLRRQIAAINLEIAALKRESANAARTIDEIQSKVERLPQREQELISLTRNYDNLKKSYDELLAKKLDSKLSQRLEEKQRGEQFLILDPATLPSQPFKPDRPMVLGLTFLVSLIIGAGGSIGLEMADTTLRGSRDFKRFFDLPVLASLPVIQDDRYKRRIATRRAAVIGGLVSILGTYLVFLMTHGEQVRSIIQAIGESIGGGN
jgi:polysaccharide biosynthesis transport protein